MLVDSPSTAFLLTSALLVVGGCTLNAPCSNSACGEADGPISAGAALTVGSVAPGAAFVALPSGGETRAIHGSQGTYHVWLAVQATGLQRDRLTERMGIRHRLTYRADGGLVSVDRVFRPVEQVSQDGTLTVTGLLMQTYEEDPTSWHHTPMNLTVWLDHGLTPMLETSQEWNISCCEEFYWPDGGSP